MPSKAKLVRKAPAPVSKVPESSTSPPNSPNWPALRPLLPISDLALVPLLADHILTIPHFWTNSLCKTYVTFLQTLPLVTTPGKPKRGDAVRVNDRHQIDDASFAEHLWRDTALKSLVEAAVIDGEALSATAKRELWGGEILGLNSNIRIYRYSKGQYFDQHYDDSNPLTFPSQNSTSPVAARTTWTLLLYLTAPTTGCRGGETVFYPDAPSKRAAAPAPIVAELEVGMALLHRHGRECLLHEGREVTAGEKWVIRSDLCVKR
ncbi:hypothetical protein LTR08_000747 [Meristemomyces frigidus]|nr:hypothetical protein LTR08_000747 [Meristemomyces frigidus]